MAARIGEGRPAKVAPKFNHVTKALQQIRIEKNLSLARLARKLDVGPTTVSHWERGLWNPKLDTLFNWAAALGCTIEVKERSKP